MADPLTHPARAADRPGEPAVGAPAPHALESRNGDSPALAMPPRMAALRGILRTARPRQWTKNVLVVAAPGAAGVLAEPPVLVSVALAFVAFCLTSSGTYFLNDVRDVESDRRHPLKRHRPVAAGAVAVPAATGLGIALLVAGFAVAYAVGLGFLAVLSGYVLLTSAYTLWLKHVAVVDIAVVASGFILRAVAGGVAAGVPISRWFLIVASFGSLFMVAGKRYGEHLDLGEERGRIRTTLGAYSAPYLRYVWTVASGVTLAAYCLWAFEEAEASAGAPWFELSIVPFVMGILRYALLLEKGRGGAPEEIVLGDRTLQLIGLVWVALFGCGVYLGR